MCGIGTIVSLPPRVWGWVGLPARLMAEGILYLLARGLRGRCR